ncbi:MAG: hypothetical protein ACRC6E_13350, partial [Fusobacteriaceae bacterium]
DYNYSNVRVATLGEYDLEVSGDKKSIGFGVDIEKPSLLMFDMVMANKENSLTVKNFSDKRVEISAIYYTVNFEKEVI